MNFGPFQIFTLETGRFALDGGAMFGVVPKNLWNRTIDADEQNRIPMTMRSMLIQYRERNILIDTGIGRKNSDKFNKIYDVDFSRFTLEDSLKTLNLAPEDITDVIQTHLHFDHTGGTTYLDDNGDSHLTFPHAKHYIQKKHWEWACSPTLKDQASFIKADFLPVQNYGKLELLDGPEELFPGLQLHIVNGHTEAQQLVEVRDGERSILFAGDLVPMSHHVPAPYIMGYDIRPLVTLDEKLRMLHEAAGKSTVLVFEHDREVEAATVKADGNKFAVQNKGTLESVIAGLQ